MTPLQQALELLRYFGSADAHVLEVASRQRKDLLAEAAGQPVNRLERWWSMLWQPWRLARTYAREAQSLRQRVRALEGLLKKVHRAEEREK